MSELLDFQARGERLQRIINLDSKISHCAFELGVPEKKLNWFLVRR